MSNQAMEMPYEHPGDANDARQSEARSGTTMRTLRRALALAGLMLCALGGLAAWRAAHPTLPAQAQIAAQLEEMRSAVESRRAGTITNNLAPGFAWNNMDGKTFRAALGRSLMQWRDVRLALSGQRVAVRGDEATSTGHYSLTLRESPGAPAHTYSGDFTLLWQRQNGKWRVSRADGGQNLPGIGGADGGEF